MEDALHVPVLLQECLDGLAIDTDGVYLDGTLGLGGHSFEIASRLTKGRLICIDKDDFALKRASERLAPFAGRVTFVHSDFRYASSVVRDLGVGSVNGMLFDLGASSPQLDDAERGFSYMQDAPLDMRMDRTSSLTAYDVVNTYPAEDLARIFFEYGEEKFSRKIAAAIEKVRMAHPLETTSELVSVIKGAMPASALREKQHPAKRCFQAIRIEVNDELGAVREMMRTAPDALAPGGRLCVISFHSLEDRIVKTEIQKRENGCTCPREAPICTCGFVRTLRSVTRKPITASEAELKSNPRSRSAKLRIAERV
ncbi:MAG: 16S rRNA (cytosine(1402)-N(4))-methyltransferase RsmH [Oscillospiraceae bacterium]|nr:16S rRNA (cytosine(1402)-N(4))-methyltransferase RsmH [Oscillospiraceae bacterium]